VTVAGSNLAGVTQAENWLLLTGFPFIFFQLHNKIWVKKEKVYVNIKLTLVQSEFYIYEIIN
tara:strand:+ start:154 stop:339 length:186 start_codon:yes stop_codon:yes gene_type:complete